MVGFFCHRTEEDALYFKPQLLFTMTEEEWKYKDKKNFLRGFSYLYHSFWVGSVEHSKVA